MFKHSYLSNEYAAHSLIMQSLFPHKPLQSQVCGHMHYTEEDHNFYVGEQAQAEQSLGLRVLVTADALHHTSCTQENLCACKSKEEWAKRIHFV